MIQAFCPLCSKRYLTCSCGEKQKRILRLMELGCRFRWLNERDYEITYFVPMWVDGDTLRTIGERPYMGLDREDATYWAQLKGVGRNIFEGVPATLHHTLTTYPWSGKPLQIVEQKKVYSL